MAKAMLRGKFIAMSVYIKQSKSSQINNLTMHFKVLQKQRQTKPKISSQNEIIKILQKWNGGRLKEPYKESTKNIFFEKMNNTSKLLQTKQKNGEDPNLENHEKDLKSTESLETILKI
jgi:hypothetical protein